MIVYLIKDNSSYTNLPYLISKNPFESTARKYSKIKFSSLKVIKIKSTELPEWLSQKDLENLYA